MLWAAAPAGWQVDSAYLTIPNPPEPVSQETRIFEFELKAPENAAPGPISLPLYTLYYVCEARHGTCLYRRQDLRVNIALRDG